jgi:hypothetical protein
LSVPGTFFSGYDPLVYIRTTGSILDDFMEYTSAVTNNKPTLKEEQFSIFMEYLNEDELTELCNFILEASEGSLETLFNFNPELITDGVYCRIIDAYLNLSGVF